MLKGIGVRVSDHSQTHACEIILYISHDIYHAIFALGLQL